MGRNIIIDNKNLSLYEQAKDIVINSGNLIDDNKNLNLNEQAKDIVKNGLNS